jgi:hypothetical protein
VPLVGRRIASERPQRDPGLTGSMRPHCSRRLDRQSGQGLLDGFPHRQAGTNGLVGRDRHADGIGLG